MLKKEKITKKGKNLRKSLEFQNKMLKKKKKY